MSDYDDYEQDKDSHARPSRDRRRSPDDDRDSHRSSDGRKSKLSSKEMASIGKKAAEKSGGLFSPEDWMCKSCGNINWARRTTCNMCNMPKYQKTEARTGAGGGYNERDNVEYNERQDESDGEYDEFGRKKKKFRNFTKNSDETSNDGMSSTNKSKSQTLAEDDEDDDEEEEEDEDDDDDEFDAKKYALDSEDDANEKEENNHRQASSSISNKKSSSSGERPNSRSSSSSADDRSENRKSHQATSSNSRRRSNSPRSSKRKDDYPEQRRRRSRSRSPISPSNRTHQKSSRH